MNSMGRLRAGGRFFRLSDSLRYEIHEPVGTPCEAFVLSQFLGILYDRAARYLLGNQEHVLPQKWRELGECIHPRDQPLFLDQIDVRVPPVYFGMTNWPLNWAISKRPRTSASTFLTPRG
jgi:hypothetical protein